MDVDVLDLLRVLVAILSLGVLGVGAVAYRRRPTRRMLLVLALFVAFAAQGVLLLVEVFLVDTVVTESAYYLFQLVEVLLLSAAILAR